MSISKLASAIGFALASFGAGAATVTFDELTTPVTTFYDTVTSSGFTFTSNETGNLGVWGDDLLVFSADVAGATLHADIGGSIVTMTAANADLFDLVSIDFADILNDGSSGTIDFTFEYFAGGTATQTFTLDDEIGLQTFALNQFGLSSVSWASSGGAAFSNQFDNIQANPIPEPSTYALMLAGLAAVGVAAKRRKG